MARLIWTEPAIKDLDTIAEYIALDKPDAAQRYIQRVFTAVERLSQFPRSGSIPPEIPNLPYRQVIVPPCRVFYRFSKDYVFIIFVMRSEQSLRQEVLIGRGEDQSNQSIKRTR
jgi:toxin ParE1/3/4